MRDSQIVGKDGVADDIGNDEEGEAGYDDRHGRESVETVRQVYRVAGPHHDHGGEGDVEPAEIDHWSLEEGDIEIGARPLNDDPAANARDEELGQQAHLAGDALMVALRYLVIVIEEPDQAETDGNDQSGPEIRVGKIHPQDYSHRDRGRNHEPHHFRRSALGQVALRDFVASVLSLSTAAALPSVLPGARHRRADQG